MKNDYLGLNALKVLRKTVQHRKTIGNRHLMIWAVFAFGRLILNSIPQS
jgi:hypothetical protein